MNKSSKDTSEMIKNSNESMNLVGAINDEKKSSKDKFKPVSSFEMFRFASWGVRVIYFIGTISALACGASQIIAMAILGELFDVMNKPNGDISSVALKFVYLGLGVFFCRKFRDSLFFCCF